MEYPIYVQFFLIQCKTLCLMNAILYIIYIIYGEKEKDSLYEKGSVGNQKPNTGTYYDNNEVIVRVRVSYPNSSLH